MKRLFWILVPLGIFASSMTIASIIAHRSEITFASPPAALLEGYRSFIGGIFYYFLEWWSGIKVPQLWQDFIALWGISFSVIARHELWIKKKEERNFTHLIVGAILGPIFLGMMVNFYLKSQRYQTGHVEEWRTSAEKNIENGRKASHEASMKVYEEELAELKEYKREINMFFMSLIATPVGAALFFLWNYLAMTNSSVSMESKLLF